MVSRHMHCLVIPIQEEDGYDKLISLVEPSIYNVCPTDGGNVTIVEYRIDGALMEAIPREMEGLGDIGKLVCKQSTIRYGPDLPDLITLSPAVLTEDSLENLAKVKRVELWLGDCFIATGDIDQETHVVRYTEERLTIPFAAIPDVPIITKIYVDDENIDPKICYEGAMVQDGPDKEKVKKIKLNITFTYSNTNDLNILAIADGRANTLYPRLVKSSGRVCCLFNEAPPHGVKHMVFTTKEFESWLNTHYIFCPPLPITVKTVDY